MALHDCILFYDTARGGLAWVRYGGVDVEFDANRPTYASLASAFAASVRAGHLPTKWARPSDGTPIEIDQAAHWLTMMRGGAL